MQLKDKFVLVKKYLNSMPNFFHELFEEPSYFLLSGILQILACHNVQEVFQSPGLAENAWDPGDSEGGEGRSNKAWLSRQPSSGAEGADGAEGSWSVLWTGGGHDGDPRSAK